MDWEEEKGGGREGKDVYLEEKEGGREGKDVLGGARKGPSDPN